MNEQQDAVNRIAELEERVDILDHLASGRALALQAILVEILAQLDEGQVEGIIDSAMPNYDFDSLMEALEEHQDELVYQQSVLDVTKETIHDIDTQVSSRREEK